MSHLGVWTRDNVLELHIFILLLIWFVADRCNFYFTDIPRYWYMIKLYWGAWRARAPKDYPARRGTNSAGPR